MAISVHVVHISHLYQEGSEIFGNLPKPVSSIVIETKLSLVYMAGYVTREDPELIITGAN